MIRPSLSVATDRTNPPPLAINPSTMLTTLGLGASDLARVRQIVGAVTRHVEALAGRPIWYRKWQELDLVSKKEKLWLTVWPLQQVVSVTAEGNDTAETEGTEDDEYQVYERYLRMRNGLDLSWQSVTGQVLAPPGWPRWPASSRWGVVYYGG